MQLYRTEVKIIVCLKLKMYITSLQGEYFLHNLQTGADLWYKKNSDSPAITKSNIYKLFTHTLSYYKMLTEYENNHQVRK